MNVHFNAAVSAMQTLNMSRKGLTHICTPKSTWIDMQQGPGIRARSVTSRVQVIRGSKFEDQAFDSSSINICLE